MLYSQKVPTPMRVVTHPTSNHPHFIISEKFANLSFCTRKRCTISKRFPSPGLQARICCFSFFNKLSVQDIYIFPPHILNWVGRGKCVYGGQIFYWHNISSSSSEYYIKYCTSTTYHPYILPNILPYILLNILLAQPIITIIQKYDWPCIISPSSSLSSCFQRFSFPDFFNI